MPGEDLILKINSLIWYHLKINPGQLNDQDYFEAWRWLQWAMSFESKRYSLKDGETLEL
ncbi:MAG: hypothetical protein P0Y49_15405 [Candidatus Pedobacter colombiensis]|uniref:Uncharacterized protein n=1 Tax=Candidatus Pedobacter colombiensis TaxID=3121371 RepID=A0AAJ5W7Y8_9SPHI|nr:hypothetical protein [Pedobacter sp.]WEK18177.1 MAG: hypothetical protein P0Y49_15405 [Pedobacter sp.]